MKLRVLLCITICLCFKLGHTQELKQDPEQSKFISCSFLVIKKWETVFPINIYSASKEIINFCPEKIYVGNNALTLTVEDDPEERSRFCEYSGQIFGNVITESETYDSLFESTFKRNQGLPELEIKVFNKMINAGSETKYVSAVYCPRYSIENIEIEKK